MPLTKTPIVKPFDVDAQRFILAAGLTRFVDKRAINYLVQNLKTNNLWTKCAAIYPMVGGNVWSCKFNLINPIDSDLAFRLTFVASPTIAFSGVKWNGSTQYCDTHFNPASSSITALNSTHISYYSRDNTAGSLSDIGNTVTPNLLLLGISNVFVVNSALTDSRGNADTRGYFILSRTGAAVTNEYKNGVSVFSNVLASSAIPSASIYIGARNVSGVASNFTNRQCAFASIGSGLSATDAFVFSQIVQQFQIILSRNV